MTAPAAETAQFHLETRVPTASPDEQVSALVARLASEDFPLPHPIYLLDQRGASCGIVPLSRLLGGELRTGALIGLLIYFTVVVAMPA